jgi:hypothetical protein
MKARQLKSRARTYLRQSSDAPHFGADRRTREEAIAGQYGNRTVKVEK